MLGEVEPRSSRACESHYPVSASSGLPVRKRVSIPAACAPLWDENRNTALRDDPLCFSGHFLVLTLSDSRREP
ncbi:hypothetical protein MHYP_G00230240 [Metynnis hypsauchen]